MGKNSKGPAFEREVCKQLSLWWTGGERDDIFWRTHGSGARATTRGKAGKRTAGQYGDIAASDPAGHPLIRYLTISLKRGYNRHTLHDLLDMPAGKDSEWQKWISEIRATSKAAGSVSWAIIAKRDRRMPIILLPYKMKEQLKLRFVLDFGSLVGMLFSHFLSSVTPDQIRELVEP